MSERATNIGHFLQTNQKDVDACNWIAKIRVCDSLPVLAYSFVDDYPVNLLGVVKQKK